jgi:hypothetical protein
MTSPGNLPRAGAVPIGIIKEQTERLEVLMVRLAEQANSTRRIRMRYCGMEPEAEAPTDRADTPDDLHNRMVSNNNQIEELLNRLEGDLNKLDNAY